MPIDPNTPRTIVMNDPIIMALLTGGVYTSEQTRQAGITQGNTPLAYDVVTKKLKPVLVITLLGDAPVMAIQDYDGQYQSMRNVMQLWFYQEGSTGRVSIKAAKQRAYQLFQFRPWPGLNELRFIGGQNDKNAQWLNEASLETADYQIDYIESVNPAFPSVTVTPAVATMTITAVNPTVTT